MNEVDIYCWLVMSVVVWWRQSRTN